MSKSNIAVVVDTNGAITKEEAKKLGVYLMPMPFSIDGQEYFEGVNCSYEHFFEELNAGHTVSTSQPSPKSLTDLWDKLLESYDAVLHIPMSSGLSSSCATAKAIAADYNGRVCVPDNKRISISQRCSVLDALILIDRGYSCGEICQKLEETALDASIYLAVNTLELLKKSGRVTAAGAALATILGLKPVLQIQGAKLDAYAKARGMANAEKTMLEALEKDIATRFAGKKYEISAAYSGDLAPAKEWLKKMQAYFHDDSIKLYALPISISCHVGGGVKALGCIQRIE